MGVLDLNNSAMSRACIHAGNCSADEASAGAAPIASIERLVFEAVDVRCTTRLFSARACPNVLAVIFVEPRAPPSREKGLPLGRGTVERHAQPTRHGVGSPKK